MRKRQPRIPRCEPKVRKMLPFQRSALKKNVIHIHPQNMQYIWHTFICVLTSLNMYKTVDDFTPFHERLLLAFLLSYPPRFAKFEIILSNFLSSLFAGTNRKLRRGNKHLLVTISISMEDIFQSIHSIANHLLGLLSNCLLINSTM